LLLSTVIQHHPSRVLPPELARYEVVTDPDPNGKPSAIRTYIECLRRTPPGVSHRLVLQDDVKLVRDFDSRAHHALRERPDTLVAFFVPGMGLHGRWVREAAKRGDRWVQLPPSANWVPTVALAWPRKLAEAFVPFAEEHVAERARRRMSTLGDDPVVGRFVRQHKLAVWATVPCLVEHPDLMPSLVKQRSYQGRNPARRAAVFTAD
jgi:hypothetical protein